MASFLMLKPPPCRRSKFPCGRRGAAATSALDVMAAPDDLEGMLRAHIEKHRLSAARFHGRTRPRWICFGSLFDRFGKQFFRSTATIGEPKVAEMSALTTITYMPCCCLLEHLANRS